MTATATVTPTLTTTTGGGERPPGPSSGSGGNPFNPFGGAGYPVGGTSSSSSSRPPPPWRRARSSTPTSSSTGGGDKAWVPLSRAKGSLGEHAVRQVHSPAQKSIAEAKEAIEAAQAKAKACHHDIAEDSHDIADDIAADIAGDIAEDSRIDDAAFATNQPGPVFHCLPCKIYGFFCFCFCFVFI